MEDLNQVSFDFQGWVAVNLVVNSHLPLRKGRKWNILLVIKADNFGSQLSSTSDVIPRTPENNSSIFTILVVLSYQ